MLTTPYYCEQIKTNNMAQIDFEYNAEINGRVQYFDVNGKLVVEYTLDDLQAWMYKTGYNISDSYLDANWIFLSTEFFKEKNKEEFKSGNTVYPYGKQGLYNVNN